eukprot:1244043-Amphidinium_carterae.1
MDARFTMLSIVLCSLLVGGGMLKDDAARHPSKIATSARDMLLSSLIEALSNAPRDRAAVSSKASNRASVAPSLRLALWKRQPRAAQTSTLFL